MDQPVNGVTLDTPTENWEEALITGNGRHGALCYGGPEAVRVTLSHERLFLPLRPPLEAPHTAAILDDLRALLRTGRYQDAADAVVRHAAAAEPAYAETVWIDPLIGAGTLVCTPPAGGPVWDFRRTTDFTTGVVTHAWRTGAGEVGVDVFASRAHDVVVVRLRGASGWRLAVEPIAGEPPAPLPEYELNHWPLAPDLYAVRVGSMVDVPADWGTLLRAHTALHRDLFDRVHLDLGGVPVQRLFDAGRYAIISSSGELPPTLQGVWSATYHPAWQSGYTVDGNLQAAVAGLLPTGTPELMLPVFDLLDGFVDDFRHNAQRLYGANGILTPAHVSTHGRQIHFGPVWCQTFWTAGAAWLSRLYYDYWRYTGDRDFLRDRALPFLRQAAEFYLDFAPDGVFAPSYSPENAPPATGSQACINATMDVAAVADLLRNLLAGTAALGIDDPDAPRWQALLAALPAYRIGAGGELAEWIWPGLDDNHAHRHSSHFYPLWYELDPAIAADPALRAAAEVAVRRRLAFWRTSEADEMAFGLVQIGLAAAQLGMTAEAYEALTMLATRYWRPSLVSTHNLDAIFNVDISGGLPALVAALLVRSGPGRVDLLPALPAEWPAGSVSGLAARNQVTLRRLAWSDGQAEAILMSRVDQRLTVGLPRGEARLLDLTAGADTVLTFQTS